MDVAHPLRFLLVVLILVGPLLAVMATLWVWRATARFLVVTPRLTSEADLEGFKRIAALNMYAALVAAPLLVASPFLFFAGKAMGALGGIDLVAMIAAYVVVIGVNVGYKPRERATQAIPAVDELTAVRDGVVRTWRNKVLPDW